MSVLELSEESRSLRQASKAWASGDIPTADYRMIRRATLEGMLGISDPDDDEDELPPDSPENHAEPREDTEVIDAAGPGDGSMQRSSVLLIAAVLIVAGGALVLLLVS